MVSMTSFVTGTGFLVMVVVVVKRLVFDAAVVVGVVRLDLPVEFNRSDVVQTLR